MDILIILYTFATLYFYNRGKGKEICQQINTTMNIQDIRKSLIGKKISWFDGFSGSSDWFTIGHVKNAGGSVRVRAEKGKGWGIFIPKNIIDTLLSNGNYVQGNSLEGCSYVVKWAIC